MGTDGNVRELDRAMHTAHAWVNEVARCFGTEDREFAYRALRAWLHALRDGLAVDAAAHFSAQLPDLVRGIFYANWNPATAPQKYDADVYTDRFARDACISADDVATVAPTVTAAVAHHLPLQQLEKVFGQLPREIRTLIAAQVVGGPL